MLSNNLKVVGALLVTAIVSTPAVASATAYDNFPLEANNLWVYASYDDSPLSNETIWGLHTMRVVQEHYYGGGWYVNRLDGLMLEPQWMWDHINYSPMWVDYEGQFSMLYDFGANPDDSWIALSNGGVCSETEVTYLGDQFGTDTPAGDFDNTKTFDTSPTQHTPAFHCAFEGPRTTRISFAEGIGPVEMRNKGTQTDKLLYAYIDGQIAAASHHAVSITGDIETTVVVTEEEYEYGSTATAAVIVRNNGNTTWRRDYNNGCQLGLSLTDTFSGEVVYPQGWGFDRFCTQALTFVELEPGEARVFYANMPLQDSVTGDDIRGSYILSAGIAPDAGADVAIGIGTHAQFPCGDMSCATGYESCSHTTGGAQPPPGIPPLSIYSCDELPTECSDDPTCECLFPAGVSFGSCREEDNGGLYVDIYAP